MKYILITTILLLLITGGVLLYRYCSTSTTKINSVETATYFKTDTLIVFDTIEVRGKARIILIKDSTGASNNYFAEWDSSDANGFKATVKYFPAEKLFVNSFIIPKNEVTNEVIKTNTIKEYLQKNSDNKFIITAGVASYINRNEPLLPFLSLAYSKELLSLNFCIEAKTLIKPAPGTKTFAPVLELSVSKEL